MTLVESINGVSTLAVPDPASLLRGQAGRQVLLRVQPKGKGPARDAIAVPIKPREAAELLKSQAAANAAAPAPAKIPNIEKENRALTESADELAGGSRMSSSRRKQMQYENWQDKNQKR